MTTQGATPNGSIPVGADQVNLYWAELDALTEAGLLGGGSPPSSESVSGAQLVRAAAGPGTAQPQVKSFIYNGFPSLATKGSWPTNGGSSLLPTNPLRANQVAANLLWPGVTGMSYVMPWSQMEPAAPVYAPTANPGPDQFLDANGWLHTYNFTCIDYAMADHNPYPGAQFLIRPLAGKFAPTWLFPNGYLPGQTAPSNAVKSLNISSNGQTITFHMTVHTDGKLTPLPWDPTYLLWHNAFISAMAAHVTAATVETNGYTAADFAMRCFAFQMAGVGTLGEMTLDYAKVSLDRAASADKWSSLVAAVQDCWLLQSTPYSDVNYTQAWKTIIHTFDSIFGPGSAFATASGSAIGICLDLDEPFGFNQTGMSGTTIPPAVTSGFTVTGSGSVATTLTDSAVSGSGSTGGWGGMGVALGTTNTAGAVATLINGAFAGRYVLRVGDGNNSAASGAAGKTSGLTNVSGGVGSLYAPITSVTAATGVITLSSGFYTTDTAADPYTANNGIPPAALIAAGYTIIDTQITSLSNGTGSTDVSVGSSGATDSGDGNKPVGLLAWLKGGGSTKWPVHQANVYIQQNGLQGNDLNANVLARYRVHISNAASYWGFAGGGYQTNAGANGVSNFDKIVTVGLQDGVSYLELYQSDLVAAQLPTWRRLMSTAPVTAQVAKFSVIEFDNNPNDTIPSGVQGRIIGWINGGGSAPSLPVSVSTGPQPRLVAQVGDLVIDRGQGCFWLLTAVSGTAPINQSPVSAGTGQTPTWQQIPGAAATAPTLYSQTSGSASGGSPTTSFGTAVNLGVDGGWSQIIPSGILITTTGVGSETITAQVTATFTDNSTTNVTVGSITTNTVTAMSTGTLGSLFTDGKAIKQLGVQLKSTITSSTAACTMKVFGRNA